MDIIKFFNSDEVELPRRRGEKDFEEFITELFENYVNAIDQQIGNDDITKGIQKSRQSIIDICESVKRAISEYLEGFPSKAFSSLKDAIENETVKKCFETLYSGDLSKSARNFYRMRTVDNQKKGFSKEEMFHIPFESRHLVRTQRYSIPGLPCLYLGASVYVCWEELGQPDCSKIQVSRLEMEPNRNIKILDFGYRHAHMAAMINGEGRNIESWQENLAFAYAVCWPIIAACSIVVKEKKSPFKVEYIVPQLIMQWLKTNKEGYHGIRYFSMNIDKYLGSPRLFQNFAFPVVEKSETGFCNFLKGSFKITEAVSLQNTKADDVLLNYDNMPEGKIQLNDKSKKEYRDTDLGKIEAVLNGKDTFTMR